MNHREGRTLLDINRRKLVNYFELQVIRWAVAPNINQIGGNQISDIHHDDISSKNNCQPHHNNLAWCPQKCHLFNFDDLFYIPNTCSLLHDNRHNISHQQQTRVQPGGDRSSQSFNSKHPQQKPELSFYKHTTS